MSILDFENIRFVPAIHQRMAFAEEVRQQFLEIEPDCVAVELPESLSAWIVRGAMRLPQISAVCLPRGRSAGENEIGRALEASGEGAARVREEETDARRKRRRKSDKPGGERRGEVEVVPIDPCDAMIEAVRLAVERQVDIAWIDAAPEPGIYPEIALPDDYVAEKAGLAAYVREALPYLRAARSLDPETQAVKERREEHMARRLIALGHRHRRVLCVLGMAHFPAVVEALKAGWEYPAQAEEEETSTPAEGAFLAHVRPKNIANLMREIPHVAAVRETVREELGAGEGRRFDKLLALRETLKEAEVAYAVEYSGEINLMQWKALYQFTRNLAIAQGMLTPDIYTLVMGAKGTVDGDFGWEVYRVARSYDLQDKDATLPKMRMKDGQATFSDREGTFDAKTRFGDPPTEKVMLNFRRRPSPEMKAMWKEQWGAWDERGICSWPPEDETQEKFMAFIRARALQVLSEDKKQVVEFTTSMMDGLDVRETMRNWHQGKLYVQQTPQPQGKVGAVVMAFDDPRADPFYSWRTTLYAENNNESDISFYASPLGENVVGPRISKTEFGGILSVYPAIGLPDVWRIPGVNTLRTCAEVLLAGAILFAPDRHIAYVARRPPGSQMRNLAAHYKKNIVFLPIQSFAPRQIKRIRGFHILGGRDVRSYAADYIFED